jgi:hypothetical protein
MATIIFRPQSDVTSDTVGNDGGTSNLYSYIDEEIADDTTTYLNCSGIFDYITSFGNGNNNSGVINNIKFVYRARASGSLFLHFRYYYNTSEYSDVLIETGFEWTTLTTSGITLNPVTGLPWVWDDIQNLQFGFDGETAGKGQVYVTQVYLEVDYTNGEGDTINARPFAVYTGTIPPNTTKMGNLLIGGTGQTYGKGSPGNTNWYMGPDETNGYIIGKDNGSEPTFWRSAKTDADFIALGNYLAGGGLSTVQDVKDWLSTNNYYHDYPL